MRFKSRPIPFATQARSLFSSYAGKLLSVCLTTAIVAISIALIAGAAATLDWVHNYHANGNGAVPMWFHNTTEYDTDINNATWRVDIDYNPGALRMDDIRALLVAGILGTVTGLLLYALPFWPRTPRPMEVRLPRSKVRLSQGTDKRTLSPCGTNDKLQTRRFELTSGSATTALDAFLALLFLIVAGLVWARYNGSRNPYNSIYNLPDHHLNHTVNIGPDGMAFEKWTCALAAYISRGALSPSQEQLLAQCHKARTNRHLTVPLLVLALVRLSLRPMEIVLGWAYQWAFTPVAEFLEWKKHTREMREGRGTELHDPSGKRVGDEEEGGHARDSVQEDDHADDFIAELPGWRMSRAEMAEDAAMTEMPGAEGGKEMDAGVAAVEKDAEGKS